MFHLVLVFIQTTFGSPPCSPPLVCVCVCLIKSLCTFKQPLVRHLVHHLVCVCLIKSLCTFKQPLVRHLVHHLVCVSSSICVNSNNLWLATLFTTLCVCLVKFLFASKQLFCSQAATAQRTATGSLGEQMQASLAAERAKHAKEMEVIIGRAL